MELDYPFHIIYALEGVHLSIFCTMSSCNGSTPSIASIDKEHDLVFDTATSDHLEEAINQRVEANRHAIRRVVRKVDMRLLPALGVLYAFALVDRVNLGNVSSNSIADTMSPRVLQVEN